MKLFRYRFRSRFVCICIVLATLLLCLTVPASAAITSADDGVLDLFTENWSSTYSPTGLSNSWFWQVLSQLRVVNSSLEELSTISGYLKTQDTLIGKLNSGWTQTSNPLPGSWFSFISTRIDYIYDNVTEIWYDTTSLVTEAISIDSHLSNLKTYVSNYIPGMSDLLSDVELHLQDLPGIHDDLQTLDSVVDKLLTNSNAMEIFLQSIAGTNTTLSYGLDALHDDFNTQIRLVNGSLTSLSNGMDKLVEVFASSEDLALKDKTKDSIVAVKDNIPDTSLSIGSLMSFQSLFDVSSIQPELPELLFSLFDGLAFWYSSDTASSLRSNSASFYSLRSFTPFYDSNLLSLKEDFNFD